MSDYYKAEYKDSKEYKEESWDVAIGLQAVDDLKVSGYLKTLSKEEIDGALSLDEIEELLYQHYNNSAEDTNSTHKEADLVASRIAMLLRDESFTFSPVTLKYIHGILFKDIYDHAGKFRKYNISKNEPILGGRTVNYANYNMIDITYQYDFDMERKTPYQNMAKEDVIKRLARFTSSIWQVHPFGEGNTRTTAVFIELYLNNMGFEVDNTLFSKHSKYFRNALVRSNYADYKNQVDVDFQYLEKFFENLLFEGEHILKSRELIVKEYLPEIKQHINSKRIR